MSAFVADIDDTFFFCNNNEKYEGKESAFQTDKPAGKSREKSDPQKPRIFPFL
jgi:hypothetical protein